jgi:hypothetical protein
MNIIEAIKSGKRFKRSTDTTYRDLRQYYYKSDPAFYLLHIEDILSDDWEVESSPVGIALSDAEFDAAFSRARNRTNLIYGSALILFHKELKKELGL